MKHTYRSGIQSTSETTSVSGRMRKAPSSAPPPVRKQVLSAGRALVDEARAVTRKVEPVPGEEVERRLAICKSCDHWTGRRCRVCGCLTALKARLRSQSCPRGKW